MHKVFIMTIILNTFVYNDFLENVLNEAEAFAATVRQHVTSIIKFVPSFLHISRRKPTLNVKSPLIKNVVFLIAKALFLGI